MSKTIPLMRASQLLPFVEHLEGHGLDAAALLRQCYCPVSANLEDSDCIAPTNRVWQFIEETAFALGDKNCGWNIAMKFGVYGGGRFAYDVENQTCLSDSIERYSQTIVQHANASVGTQESDGQSLWFYRATIPLKGSPYVQVEQYAVGTLLHIVRCFLGPRWKPARMAIVSPLPSPAMAQSCGELIVGASRAGIEIPTSDLKAKRQPMSNSLKNPGRQYKSFPVRIDHVLRQMLRHYSIDYPVDRETVSKILEIHPRALNRLMQKSGVRFNDIRKEVVVERAMKELASNHRSIGEISDLLGYANQSALSRAFSDATGTTPRDYRVAVRTAK